MKIKQNYLVQAEFRKNGLRIDVKLNIMAKDEFHASKKAKKKLGKGYHITCVKKDIKNEPRKDF